MENVGGGRDVYQVRLNVCSPKQNLIADSFQELHVGFSLQTDFSLFALRITQHYRFLRCTAILPGALSYGKPRMPRPSVKLP